MSLLKKKGGRALSEAVTKEKVLNQVLEILDATGDINYNVHELRAFIRGELNEDR
jgi:hypothetical protein